METSKYILENENGERFDLTPPANIYMVNVEGLGVSSSLSYGDLGSGFFAVLNSKDPQNSITGDLIYRVGAFGFYESFVNWLQKAKTLYFCYTPLQTEYRRIVKLRYINKDKRDHGGWMRTSISFDPLSPWFLPVPAEIGITVRTGNIKAYTWNEDIGEYCYVYDENLRYGGESAGDMSAQIFPTGHEPSAVLLRYYGAIVNPKIRLTGANSGTVYGICDLDITLSATETLELSTMYEDSHIVKISPDGEIENLLPYLNLAYDPYFRIPVNEPSILSIESDAAITGSAELLIYTYYRSV